ncbi:MAG TPA: acyloxyacyl hydrolase [Burkholderiaceae bacterium]|nr:acyloxyacyl hydrolase [Burkholderiaceae bacterium]
MKFKIPCRAVLTCITFSFLPWIAMAQDHPADHWEFAVEAGYLAKVKNNSPHDYRIAPTQVVWRTPAAYKLWESEDGTKLVVRNRTAVVLESIVRGPEDVYFAFAGSPSFELWHKNQKTALFYEIGGGIGLINVKKVEGAQGQARTFNWFTQLGVRHKITPTLSIMGAGYFTHHSNQGATNPNPGIDVLGVNFGLIWQLGK